MAFDTPLIQRTIIRSAMNTFTVVPGQTRFHAHARTDQVPFMTAVASDRVIPWAHVVV